MNPSRFVRIFSSAVNLSLALFLIPSCSSRFQNRFQGYVEGEFVYVASALAGQLDSLQVRRGDQVKVGDPLFALDETAEKAALDMAQAAFGTWPAIRFCDYDQAARSSPSVLRCGPRGRALIDQRGLDARANMNRSRVAVLGV